MLESSPPRGKGFPAPAPPLWIPASAGMTHGGWDPSELMPRIRVRARLCAGLGRAVVFPPGAGRAIRESPLRCVGGGPPSARRPFAPFESLRTGFDFPQGERTPWPASLGCWLRKNDAWGREGPSTGSGGTESVTAPTVIHCARFPPAGPAVSVPRPAPIPPSISLRVNGRARAYGPLPYPPLSRGQALTLPRPAPVPPSISLSNCFGWQGAGGSRGSGGGRWR